MPHNQDRRAALPNAGTSADSDTTVEVTAGHLLALILQLLGQPSPSKPTVAPSDYHYFAPEDS